MEAGRIRRDLHGRPAAHAVAFASKARSSADSRVAQVASVSGASGATVSYPWNAPGQTCSSVATPQAANRSA